jgi:hypothetical protein
MSAVDFEPLEHVYRVAGARKRNVTGIIRDALGNPFERVAPGVLEAARQRGTAVHRACELDDAGNLVEDSLDPRIVPYVQGWREFRRHFRFEVLFAELPLFLPLYDLAGTPDCVVQFDDERFGVIDRKTGLPGPAAALQTAAYAELARPLLVPIHEIRVPIRRFALQMLPTGRPRLHEYDSPRDWPDFLACLTVLRLKERLAA